MSQKWRIRRDAEHLIDAYGRDAGGEALAQALEATVWDARDDVEYWVDVTVEIMEMQRVRACALVH